MICPKCQSDNPELNRFCGMCGSSLQDSASLSSQAPAAQGSANQEGRNSKHQELSAGPINGTSVRRPFIVSTTALPDVAGQMMNTRGTLSSSTLATTTHSGYVPSIRIPVEEVSHGEQIAEPEVAPVDPADEPIFASNNVQEFPAARSTATPVEVSEERAEVSAAEPEIHTPTRVADTPRSGSILGLTAPYEESAPHAEEESLSAERMRNAEQENVPENDAFLRFDDSAGNPKHDVSGPSFLGLGSPSQDYLLEDESPVSHGRRNLLLFALLVIAMLGVLEWRASQRGESTNPADVLHIKLPKKKGQGEVVVVPPSSTSPSSSDAASSGGDNTSATNNGGKPDLIAEPNQPAVQKSPAAQSAVTASSTEATAPKTEESPASAKSTEQAPPPAPEQPAASATSQPKEAPPQVAKSTPPAATKPPASAPKSDSKPSATKAATLPAKPAPAAADASLSAGSAELQKGIAAGPTEMGRMWLWKAMGLGNGAAPVLLADTYAQGKGVPRDCEQAMLLLNAAAKKANPRARSKLGSMYAAGECVPQDRVKAYKWFSSALEVNPGSDWLEKNRESLVKQMTPAERFRAGASR